MQKSRIIVVSSEKDKELFVKLYKVSEDKIFIVPNGTCVEELPAGDKRKSIRSKLKRNGRDTILFIGAYYNPNIEAAKFIVEEVATKLKDTDIALVGTVSDYFRNNNVPENVRLIGRVDDAQLYEWLAIVDIGINPVFSGSGINMKMLDYFSFGLPVVATWVGARGIDGVDSRDFIACNKEEFVTKIRHLLNNKELCRQIGNNARQLAEEIYDWKKISARFSNILQVLINNLEAQPARRNSFCWHSKI